MTSSCMGSNRICIGSPGEDGSSAETRTRLARRPTIDRLAHFGLPEVGKRSDVLRRTLDPSRRQVAASALTNRAGPASPTINFCSRGQAEVGWGGKSSGLAEGAGKKHKNNPPEEPARELAQNRVPVTVCPVQFSPVSYRQTRSATPAKLVLFPSDSCIPKSPDTQPQEPQTWPTTRWTLRPPRPTSRPWLTLSNTTSTGEHATAQCLGSRVGSYS